MGFLTGVRAHSSLHDLKIRFHLFIAEATMLLYIYINSSDFPAQPRARGERSVDPRRVFLIRCKLHCQRAVASPFVRYIIIRERASGFSFANMSAWDFFCVPVMMSELFTAERVNFWIIGVPREY